MGSNMIVYKERFPMFMRFATYDEIENNELIIPHRFIKWFGNDIPNSVTIALENGEVIQGSFSKADKKIYDMLPIIKKEYVQLFDILMFTYCGEDRFKVYVFDKSKVEKKFEQLVMANEDGSEGTDDDLENIPNVQEMNNIDGGFSVALSHSNVNESSHGVV
ncbi:hypothetical protein POM88_050706 [Heracleum sosnowskyi]|uniref:Uncharacterized protein n=1 Tax=Heracleum sosnowskyi TaxID=360622 RepID=A0AAD8M0M9_9APIA|nr:hypothetical protein POM88_050706 [Heracleum sosnowskyi]